MGKVSWQFGAKDYSKVIMQQTSQIFIGAGGGGKAVALDISPKQQEKGRSYGKMLFYGFIEMEKKRW